MGGILGAPPDKGSPFDVGVCESHKEGGGGRGGGVDNLGVTPVDAAGASTSPGNSDPSILPSSLITVETDGMLLHCSWAAPRTEVAVSRRGCVVASATDMVNGCCVCVDGVKSE